MIPFKQYLIESTFKVEHFRELFSNVWKKLSPESDIETLKSIRFKKEVFGGTVKSIFYPLKVVFNNHTFYITLEVEKVSGLKEVRKILFATEKQFKKSPTLFFHTFDATHYFPKVSDFQEVLQKILALPETKK